MRSALILTALFASAMADHTATTPGGDNVTPEECAAECSSAHDACVTKPGANMAECASEFAGCLGYNPYENGFVAPTACSETPPSPSSSPSSSSAAAAPTHTKSPHHHHEDGDECKCYDEYNRCRAAPGANMSYCASSYAECLGYNPFDGSHDPEEVSEKCSKEGGKEEEEGHRLHRNETRPVQQPTQQPVVSGGSGVKALDVFGLLAAGVAALL